MKLRLDKLLAEVTDGSRSEVKQWIRKGRVMVEGAVAMRPEAKVDPEKQRICLDGEEICYHAWEYYMLNKPQGVVSATTDAVHDTVLSLITESGRSDLFPVGRLDIDTEGLLFITNDGGLAHHLLSPRHHVDKTYYVEIEGNLSKEDIAALETGMDIGDDRITMPAVLEQYHDGQGSAKLYLTVREGRYHQIKRMFARLGKPVSYLKRVSMGGIKLDPELGSGQYRRLTAEEVAHLKRES